jgi:UDP-N-acetylglucosamine 2-epimerase (non-hydrolysing)
MKIMTVVGTRPEIIRLCRVIPLLDRYCEHVLVHTGQNYDDRLSGLFFRELGLREPDVYMGVRGAGFGDQVGQIMAGIEPLLREHRPDRLLLLGDTNSALTALIARRMGIPVYHMEAGNRCYDDRVPEEVNRRVIDHSSSVLMPYTHRSRENLLREGFEGQRVFVVGNPIKEVMDAYADRIAASGALTELGLEPGRYFLVTLHRAENVDLPERLRGYVGALVELAEKYQRPVICSLHPRTRDKMQAFGIDLEQAGVRFMEPFGFFDFVRLEQDAFCILSDSGTVQEEACLLRVPNVTIRDVTERPETVDCGSNVLAGCDPERIVNLVGLVTREGQNWTPPAEYLAEHVAATVCRLVLGYRVPDLAEAGWQTGTR